jgi:hypothetical protein
MNVRCQVIAVAGVTGKTSCQRHRGMRPDSATNQRRSAGSYLIEPHRRCSVAGCRKVPAGVVVRFGNRRTPSGGCHSLAVRSAISGHDQANARHRRCIANDLVWSAAATYRSGAVESGSKPSHVLGTSGNNAWPLTSHEMPKAQLAAVSQ